MINTEVLIVGGGPAGLCAAINAGKAGAEVMLIDRNFNFGGQLVKQTHMFFGSEKQYASTRGFDIASILLKEIAALPNVKLFTDATALAVYEDGVVTVSIADEYKKIKPKSIIIATGASEKSLLFPNNDLPGVYGAGAVQTLMNEHGVKPGDSVVMIGAGNIGLIVSYQLLQAGVKVKAVVEAAPKIGGYLVHASKLRRMGVPILTGHSIKEAKGTDKLESVVIWQLDEKWNGVEGTEQEIETDTLCVSVGLSPLSELLFQAGCKMKFMNVLGGFVPYRDENLRTSVKNIYIAGDVAGVEEASSAMVEGYLAGLVCAMDLGFTVENFDEKRKDLLDQLQALRHGEVGKRLNAGIQEITLK